MYELAKSSREAMKSKARRLAGEKDQKVDSSNWSPAAPLNADRKTGLQPTTGRKFNKGGKVVGKAEGAPCAFRADRKPRKCGGRVETKKATGGSLPSPEEAMESEARAKNIRVTDTKMPKPEEAVARSGKTPQDVPGRKDGGKVEKATDDDKDDRPGRATGGRTKGKTNIAINILAGGKPSAPPAMAGAPPAPGAVPVPMPAPAPAPAAPPPAMMPPMPMPGGQPPMGRKRGGRVTSYKDMDAGAGSGEGRLEKTEIQQKKRRA